MPERPKAKQAPAETPAAGNDAMQTAVKEFERRLLPLTMIAELVMEGGGGRAVDPMKVECASVVFDVWDAWEEFKDRVDAL